MPFSGAWCKIWIYFGFVFAWTKGARPRFDTSTDMGLVLVPSDAEVDSVIFRLRATDQDADFPLVFEITGNPTITPVVRIDNLPCTLYNKVCQANVILTKRLVAGRLHDFAVRVRDTKGDSNSMQATISVTNATTPRDKIFPHIPSLIMVPEDTKPGKELDYLLVRANSWSGKPVYIELWELFTIRQRQTPTQTRGVITLIGELDFETQSVYTLTMYATDPYTEPGKDTRNIAGLNLVVIVQDVQDVPPIFTLAPPLTRINNSVQPGDIVLRVHAEDGDKGVPREIVYGLVSEGNPFTPFFNVSETSGEIVLARPLEELTQITHVGAPVVLTVVAEEIRRSRDEPPAQATIVDVGFLLGEPGNTPPYFESDNYLATVNENLEPGTVINFGEQYSTKVKDEDIGKAGVFALKLENNNGTFEINPTVAERTADFVIIVRDNTLIDYELHKTLSFKIVAQEVGPATNLSATVPVIIVLRDVNDNPPVFDEKTYEVTLSENVTAGARVVQVHATDIDTGAYGNIRYTGITGEGSKAFTIDPDTGLITVAIGYTLDREVAARLVLTIEARDENGNGNTGVVPLMVNLLDVNDNPPLFDKDVYEFTLNPDLTNFTSPVFIKATDADAEPPNNIVRYEIIHGNYENKFYLNGTSGELILRSPITKIRRKKQSSYNKFVKKSGKEFTRSQGRISNDTLQVFTKKVEEKSLMNNRSRTPSSNVTTEIINEAIQRRRKRNNEDPLYTLTVRAYDLGIPHLSSETKIRVMSGIAMEARIMMFVVPGEQPNSTKTAETLATITGGRVTVLETRPYTQQNHTGGTSTLPAGGKRSIIVARVEQTEPGTPLVDVEKIRETLAANGVGIIGGTDAVTTMTVNETKAPVNGMPHTNDGQTTVTNNTIVNVQSEEVTVYKAENKLLIWLLIILGLLMLLAIAALIICCICPGCPFYMAPRKRRVHSSETLVVRADGRPKRHLHRQPADVDASWKGRKQAWSADPTRRNWQFNKRNVKNCSLPGDVAYISGQPIDIQVTHEAPRLLRDATSYHSRKSRMDEHDRMYMEDVEGQKPRGYDMNELESLHRHEMERDSEIQRQGYRQRYVEPDINGEMVREQHFYREGNAEVLRLVTRGQVEDATTNHHRHHHHHPTTLIVDGKDIILQRFIEDQKSRHELSMQDIEAARIMESHQRSKEIFQQQPPEIILVPDRLDLGHRQHVEEIGPNVQRLVIDHGDYQSPKMEKDSEIGETLRPERQDDIVAGTLLVERPPVVKDLGNKPQYAYNDVELARHKALLTRLLLKRDHRHAEGGILDSSSYLETQSLPGQVAIATQTDRTAATQTEHHVRSRSDNESDEDSRQRKKLKSRKKYGDGDWRRSRTLWMKSPIEEKRSPCFDKRLNILRKKAREVKDDRKASLEPEVLREISDSLNGNGSSYKGEEDESLQVHQKSEQTTVSYKILNEKEDSSSSSMDLCKKKREKDFGDKCCEDASDDLKMNGTESTSSPEIRIKHEKHSREKTDEKSPKKEAKVKAQKKSEGVMKPSFRILEKEFTLFTKKLSKLSDKKCQESTGSDSTSQEKLEPKEPKKESDPKKAPKKIDASQKQTTELTSSASKGEQKGKQKKEAAIVKTKQKLTYQQSHVMSTGSSEYDDAFDRTKKQARQEIKQKQPMAKPKRQAHVDCRESRKQEFRNEEVEKRKDCSSKEALKTESKHEKAGRMVPRAPKLTAVSRKDNTTEETSSGAMSNQVEGKKDTAASSIPEKISSTDSSGTNSNAANRSRKAVAEKVAGRFSDDFVVEPKMRSTEQRYTEERDEKNMKDEDCEKKSSVDVREQSTEDGFKDTKSIETEGQVGTKRVVGKSESLFDVAQQLIKSCVVPDGRREKLDSAEEDREPREAVMASETKSTKCKEEQGRMGVGESIMKLKEENGEDNLKSAIINASPERTMEYEEVTDNARDVKLNNEKGIDEHKSDVIIGSLENLKGYKEEDTRGTDDGSAMKLSDKNEVDRRESKIMLDVTKDVISIVEDMSESIERKDEALESDKGRVDETENVAKEHKEENEVIDNARENLEQKSETLLQDTEKKGMSSKELKTEEKLEIDQMLVKETEVHELPGDAKIMTDTKENIEEKSDTKDAEERMLEVEKSAETQNYDKTDLIQKTQQSVDKHFETDLSRNEKDETDESEEHKEHDESIKKHVEYPESKDEGVTAEKEKDKTTEIINKDSEEEHHSLGTVDKGKAIAKIGIGDDQIKEADFPNRETTDTEKESDLESDPKIDDFRIPENENGDENKKGRATAKISPGKHQIIQVETAFLDGEKKTSTVTEFDQGEISDKVNASTDERNIPDEGEETVRIETDEHRAGDKESILPITEEKVVVDTAMNDNQINEKEKNVLDTVKTSGQEETNVTEEITTDDHKVDVKENVFSEEERGKHREGESGTIKKEDIDYDTSLTEHENISPGKREEKHPEEEAETIKEIPKVDDEISEKENGTLETLIAEELRIPSEKKNDLPKMESGGDYEQDMISETHDISKDNVTEDKIESSEAHLPDKQFIAKDDFSPEASTSIDDDIKTESPLVKQEPDDQDGKQGISSEMSKVFHLLTDKSTSEKGSISEGTETGAKTDHAPLHSADNKIDPEEASALPTDDKTKDQLEISNGNAPSTPKMDKSLKHVEDTISVESAEKEATKDNSKTSPDKQTTITTMEIAQDDSKIDVTEPVEKERESRKDEISEEKQRASIVKESDESSSDTLTPSMHPTLEKIQDHRHALHDKGEVLQETTREGGTIVDRKLLETGGKEDELREPSSKVSSSSHGTEMFETPPPTSEKEKFALDFIISETPTDSRKIPESEKQSKSESEETKLQEGEKFVEEQTFGEKETVQSFPEKQSREERDECTISQDEGGRRDIIKEKTDELPLEENMAKEEEGDGNVEEDYADVSLPLFTNIIQSVDDLSDSDSSSDISRKTTLTTKPYQTPRHRNRQSPEKGNIETIDNIDTQNFDDEDDTSLTIKVMKDEDDETFQEAEHSSTEQPSPTIVKDKDTEFDKENEIPRNIQMPSMHEGTSSNVTDQRTQKEKQSKPKSGSERGEESTPSAKRKTRLQSHTKELDQPRDDDKSAVRKHEKTGVTKPSERKTKAPDKKRIPWQRKKKSSSEESSEERAARFQDQERHSKQEPRRRFVTDRPKQADINHVKQPRNAEEHQRIPSTSRTKSEKGRKGDQKTSPPKTGDIDTSKAQPKYMAWYKKNREEMEKKRAGLKAVDDESQLPRWLRRSMRSQKSDKDDKKTPDHGSANTTPQTRRKVKPLVNVESEQLKAIVRQGRRLRRAEGGKHEDPQIQIYATTPPTLTATDTKHHLVQHSEYKYEKMPAPFYLHPPPAPHPSPQLSPQHFNVESTTEHGHVDENFDSGIAIPLQGGNRLRHQQLLEKKSVFDIAYSEAAPSQLRADSTTPPS
ncbi:trichohyalin-like [Hylaeus volcanicus]|uniref:trichohyalin-like n=1 Tax=Hylaeus volcanicus TaxID=313075 RepID=UPI0023B87EFF|nr:trichohyalin-like [Hylaeus volcanicus]